MRTSLCPPSCQPPEDAVRSGTSRSDHVRPAPLPTAHRLAAIIWRAWAREASVRLAPESIRATSSTRSASPMLRTPVLLLPASSLFSMSRC